MVEIYMEKGFARDEAETILTVMARHKDFFIDHMMVQELGIIPPDESDSPAKQGLAMFVAFLVLGFVPLLSYVAFSSINWPTKFNPLFLISCILTGCALFLLGVIASRFTHLAWWQGGLQVFVTGGTAACVAYLAGYVYVWSFCCVCGLWTSHPLLTL
jgi:DNA damage-binding protein 1